MTIDGPPRADELQDLAHTPVLLVACDYDGTISPIVNDPAAAVPIPEAISALRALASLPDTHVAVISGRSLRDLALLSRLPSEIHLVGSHGSEFDPSFVDAMPAAASAVRERLYAAARKLADHHPDLRIEYKTTGVTFHTRTMDHHAAEKALAAVRRGPGRLDGVFAHEGKEILELLVMPTDKGRALERLRHGTGATAAIYIGDDTTDEGAFSTLTGPDIGMKVGTGATKASHRLREPADVARSLAFLAEERRHWVLGDRATPIERHTLLSDHRTAALVTSEGRVTWLCEGFDGAGVFSELIGGPRAGFFSIEPYGRSRPLSHRYLPNTLIAETQWSGLTVTDYLDISTDEDAPTRLIRVVDGEVSARVEIALRPDFGRSPTTLKAVDDGFEVDSSTTELRVIAPDVTWSIVADGQHQTAVARLSPGHHVIELVIGRPSAQASDTEQKSREGTKKYWTSWAASLQMPSLAPMTTLRHAVTLKALCSPSGAIAAASTTSLPEQLGGVRNWDYRYCWIRDASLAATSLVRLGSTTEAFALLDWLVDRATGNTNLRPVYTMSGRDLVAEASITELTGYAGSRPVRIGNAADHQIQLDIAGPVADLMHELAKREAQLTPSHLGLLDRLVDMVALRWQQADHGIWEVRASPLHHVHSKVMNWVTIDRAMSIAALLDLPVPSAWKELRQEIADDVLKNGWKPGLRTFTGTYEHDDIDAAALHVGLSGLLPPDDKRFCSTVQAVETALRDGPVVYRYRFDDGLPGREGGFLLCASWLVDAYALCGRRDDALDLFHAITALAGPSGLLSEQFDPATHTALGNFPQSYSHHGLIDNAVNLSR